MDSDNLLIIALKQIEVLASDIQTMNQLKPEDFIKAVIKISQRVATAKGLENANLPKELSRDMNQKYRECQRLVEFIKSTGYKQPINLNNLLFPTIKEMNIILEYLVELISREDQQLETADYSEKNFSKLKQSKKLSEFISESWIMPELNPNSLTAQADHSSHKLVSARLSSKQNFLVFDKMSLKLVKRKAQGCELDEKLKKMSQLKTQQIYEESQSTKMLTNEECSLSNETLKNFSKTIERRGGKNIEKSIKSIKDQSKASESQQWIELFNSRSQGFNFYQENFFDNNFVSKVQLLKDWQSQTERIANEGESNTKSIKNSGFELSADSNNSISFASTKEKALENNNDTSNNTNNNTNTDSLSISNNNNNPENTLSVGTTSNTIPNTVSNKESKIQASLSTMQSNFEQEKQDLLLEVSELNRKLEFLTKNIDSKEEEKHRLTEELNTHNETISELNKKNESILNIIESKLEALENLDKLKKNEIKEEEIDREINSLEDKYNEMVSGWKQYSNQLNFQLNEMKEEIDTKKKEYSYKYDKINQLKKDIEEMGNKTSQKSELKNFLQEEFDKIPVEVNRNKYINKISELTMSLSTEKDKWSKYLKEIKQLEGQLEQNIDILKRIDNEIEDKMFNDAKSNSSLKDGYSIFIKIRENYNVIQKNMIDTQKVKDKIRETENKVEDYRIKLKNYDLKQLQEQVEILKQENKRK
mmetsp:Transcript_18513/g.19137  ORF Transcript_18513/g.19137 Transcript_18513/m.19137 type:complete len:706 (+) Transcript_18513:18-2135(+)